MHRHVAYCIVRNSSEKSDVKLYAKQRNRRATDFKLWNCSSLEQPYSVLTEENTYLTHDSETSYS